MDRIRTRFAAAVLSLGLIAAASPAAPALTLYSIDNYNDALVSIETSTGAVTLYSEIAGIFGTPRLAYMNGTIYALNPLGGCSGGCSQPYLQGIDPTTGASTGLWWLTSGGASANCWYAEGLTSDGSRLIASVTRPFPDDTCNGRTKRLADLGTGGELSNVSGRVDENADMDHIAMSPAGQLYAIDAVSLSATQLVGRLYRASSLPNYDLVGDIALAVSENVRGTAFTPDGMLWVLVGTGASDSPRRLLRVDASSGATLEAITLQIPTYPQIVLNGLVYVPLDPTSVPHKTWGALKSRYR